MPTHNPYEQLSFAQYLENIPPQPTTPKTIFPKKIKPAKSKPELPEILKNCDYTSFESFLNTLNKRGIYRKYQGYEYRIQRIITKYHYYIPDGNKFIGYVIGYGANELVDTNSHIECHNLWGKHLEFPVVYFAQDGTMWTSNINIDLANSVSHSETNRTENQIQNFSASKWKVCTKMLHNACFLQTETELEKLVKQYNEYAYNFCKANSCEFTSILMAPQLEVLHKAGYAFARSFFKLRHSTYRYDNKAEIECFNRLCKQGKNPKEIFKTSKAVCTTLKNEANIKIWDSMRKLDKFGRLNQDTIQQAYDMGFNAEDLKNMNEVLNKTYEGRPVFTFATLVTYLNRLDMYEAIDRKEAFMLLKDYLSMCSQLHQKPKIDGDSLKREHDVTARTIRQQRNIIMAEQIKAGCEKQQVYNYQESIYFIRGVQSYDDLIDEATQQHNCVASYAGSIKTGRSMVYVMREIANPNKSLITVELSPKQKTIRQKFLAYNRPIHNKSQSEFLERWLKHVKAVDAGLVPVQEISLISNNSQPILPNEISSSSFSQSM